jgi:hypothetical protein
MAGFLCGHAANQRIADTLRISDDPARAGVGRQDAGVTPQSVLSFPGHQEGALLGRRTEAHFGGTAGRNWC